MQPPIVFDDVHTTQCECEKCNKESAVEYDEEKQELDSQFQRRGDYTGPDVAVENVKPWAPMSTEDQLVAMTRVCIKLQAQNKTLLEALEALYAAAPCASPKEWSLFRALAQASRAINAAKE